MSDPFQLPWGTTLKFLITVMQAGVPIDITGHHLVATCKKSYADADPGLAQFDNLGLAPSQGTIVPLAQSGATLGQAIVTMLDTVTRNGIPNAPAVLIFGINDNDGAGDVYLPFNGEIRVTPNPGTTRP